MRKIYGELYSLGSNRDSILHLIVSRSIIIFINPLSYLALKLRVAMAHLGVKLPDDLMVDYQ